MAPPLTVRGMAYELLQFFVVNPRSAVSFVEGEMPQYGMALSDCKKKIWKTDEALDSSDGKTAGSRRQMYASWFEI